MIIDIYIWYNQIGYGYLKYFDENEGQYQIKYKIKFAFGDEEILIR